MTVRLGEHVQRDALNAHKIKVRTGVWDPALFSTYIGQLLIFVFMRPPKHGRNSVRCGFGACGIYRMGTLRESFPLRLTGKRRAG